MRIHADPDPQPCMQVKNSRRTIFGKNFLCLKSCLKTWLNLDPDPILHQNEEWDADAHQNISDPPHWK